MFRDALVFEAPARPVSSDFLLRLTSPALTVVMNLIFPDLLNVTL